MNGDAVVHDASDLAALRDQTEQAIHDLVCLDLAGPEAEAARRAVRLTRLTLECFWLPAIDAELERSRGAASGRPD